MTGPTLQRPRLKKGLGQHHLIGTHLCRPVIEFIRTESEAVVEIGTGGGVLTEALVAAGKRPFAFDVDLHWLVRARHSLDRSDRVHWLAADATLFGWQAVPSHWPVVGNLPYNVATPIIRTLLECGRQGRMAFLVQREVADRLVARPGSKDYGLLSLIAIWWAEVEILGIVKPGSFRPPPRVDSAFVGLRPRSLGSDANYDELVSLVSQAFSQRRKTLVNALSPHWDKRQVQSWLEAKGKSLTSRAEELSVDDFRSLAESLH